MSEVNLDSEEPTAADYAEIPTADNSLTGTCQNVDDHHAHHDIPVHDEIVACSASTNFPRYHAILTSFMSHFHQKSTPYPPDHVFADQDLLAVTPNQVCAYLNAKAFGKSSPGAHDRLISNWAGIEFVRKAIGHCMPHRDLDWDVDSKTGNPVRSSQVRCLMERIRSLEKKRGENTTVLPVDALASYNVDHDSTTPQHEAPLETDGRTTTQALLRKMHARNVQFFHLVQSMDSTIRTLSKSMQQMKRLLETHNLQIRNEITRSNGIQDGIVPSLTAIDHTTTASLVSRLKEEGDGVTEALQHLTNNQDVAAQPASMDAVTVRLGPSGYCTFYNEIGKAMDLPEGFELPTCDLVDAWSVWLRGFPNHKFRMPKTTNMDEEQDTFVEAPIKPLRDMKLGCIPLPLKKKYKDGWRPILQSMVTDVEHMLEGVPPAEMDDTFINATFNAAMEALVRKAPALFEGKNEKNKSWKVATWSRKIREQQLGSKGAQRRLLGDTVQVKEDEDVAMVDQL
ncbi:hypothetical protein ACHAW6_009531 [Cyclotella cf. meneghiniana]